MNTFIFMVRQRVKTINDILRGISIIVWGGVKDF